MAQYIFSTRRRDRKSWKWSEISLWIGIFVYISFIYFTLMQNKNYKGLVESHPLLVPFAVVLFFLLIYFPTKNSMKLQKYASMLIETSRKGLHYKDFQQDLNLSWRDLKGSTIMFTVHPSLGVIPRDFRLKHSKGTIHLSHDPLLHPLEGYLDFARELKEKVPDLRMVFVSPYNFCPFCGEDKKPDMNQCGCGEKVSFVHTIKRPFYLIKSDIIVMLIASLFLGMKFLPFIIAIFVLFLGVPLILLRNKKFKPINRQFEEMKSGATRQVANAQKSRATDGEIDKSADSEEASKEEEKQPQ